MTRPATKQDHERIAARQGRHARRRADADARERALQEFVLDRIEKLELSPGDVLTLTLSDEYFDNPVLARAVERFGHQIGVMTQRQVFLLRENQKLAAAPAPRSSLPDVVDSGKRTL